MSGTNPWSVQYSTDFGAGVSGFVGVSITFSPVPVQRVNTAFGVSGTFSLAPAFTYSVSSTGSAPLPPGATFPTLFAATLSFVHSGFAKPGTYNTVVREKITGASGSFRVTVT